VLAAALDALYLQQFVRCASLRRRTTEGKAQRHRGSALAWASPGGCEPFYKGIVHWHKPKPSQRHSGPDLWTGIWPEICFGGTTPSGELCYAAPAETPCATPWLLSALRAPTAPFWEAGLTGYVRLNARTSRQPAVAVWRRVVGSGPRRGPVRIASASASVPASFGGRGRGSVRAGRHARSQRAPLRTGTTGSARLQWTQADLLQVMEEIEPNAQAACGPISPCGPASKRRSAAGERRRCGRDPAGGAGLIAGLAGLPSVEAVYALARCDSSGRRMRISSSDMDNRGARDVTPAAVRWRDHPECLRVAIETGATREVIRRSHPVIRLERVSWVAGLRTQARRLKQPWGPSPSCAGNGYGMG